MFTYVYFIPVVMEGEWSFTHFWVAMLILSVKTTASLSLYLNHGVPAYLTARLSLLEFESWCPHGDSCDGYCRNYFSEFSQFHPINILYFSIHNRFFISFHLLIHTFIRFKSSFTSFMVRKYNWFGALLVIPVGRVGRSGERTMYSCRTLRLLKHRLGQNGSGMAEVVFLSAGPRWKDLLKSAWQYDTTGASISEPPTLRPAGLIRLPSAFSMARLSRIILL